MKQIPQTNKHTADELRLLALGSGGFSLVLSDMCMCLETWQEEESSSSSFKTQPGMPLSLGSLP